MTRSEIEKHIKKKQIPIGFIKNGFQYYVGIYYENYKLHIKENGAYCWEFSDYDRGYVIGYYRNNGTKYRTLFQSKHNDMKQVLSDYLYWWEVNKDTVKDIEYFNKSISYRFTDYYPDHSYPYWSHQNKKDWKKEVRKRWVNFRKQYNKTDVRVGSFYYPDKVQHWLKQFDEMNQIMKNYYNS